MKVFRLFALWTCLVWVARGEVTLAPLFQDHAVLQRDQPLPVWGAAAPGEHVTVTFHDQTIGTTAGADGRWIVYLAAQPVSAEPAVLLVSGKNIVTIKDVLVGEVWLASGQSNMEWPLVWAEQGPEEVAAANFPALRLFTVQHNVAEQPATTVPGSWQPCTPESAKMFSGVAYYFARDLQRKFNVPVGVIGSYWGGTPIESWMANSALQEVQSWPAINARWQKSLAEYPTRASRYPEEMAAWKKAQALSLATHTPNTATWPAPVVGPGTPYALSGLFNGMIAPLQPYAMRGVIWYQGEGNWPRPAEYAELFPAMIRSWRAQWGAGDFPFYFVQLANFTVVADPTGRAWARMRDVQARALVLPATGMAVTIDIGDPRTIHPTNKKEVGRRLALVAKTQVYGIPGDFSGPQFDFVTGENGSLRVHFTHAGTGLISYSRPVQSLEVAGADHKFYPATGKIERDTLLVSAREVPQPLAVRYAWSNAPVANLFSGAGLPAVPFRSDDW
jgi:sialate O-acetylesterase